VLPSGWLIVKTGHPRHSSCPQRWQRAHGRYDACPAGVTNRTQSATGRSSAPDQQPPWDPA